MLEIIKDYKKYIICLIFVLFLALGCFLFYKSSHKEVAQQKEEVLEKVSVNDNQIVTEEIKEEKMISVDVKGAVKKPAVYSLVEGSIVNDVLKLAGLKSNSSTKNINLSKKLVDEMVIVVYTKNELKKMPEVNTTECSTPSVDISSCEGASVIVPGADSNTVTTEDKSSSLVNINTASKEVLMSLPGIGESKALSIIKYREDNNGFKSIEDVMNVSGIGEALYSKIKDYITI